MTIIYRVHIYVCKVEKTFYAISWFPQLYGTFFDKKKTSIGFYDQHCVSMTYYDHEICTDLYQNLLRTEKGMVLAWNNGRIWTFDVLKPIKGSQCKRQYWKTYYWISLSVQIKYKSFNLGSTTDSRLTYECSAVLWCFTIFISNNGSKYVKLVMDHTTTSFAESKGLASACRGDQIRSRNILNTPIMTTGQNTIVAPLIIILYRFRCKLGTKIFNSVC